jgi:4,5-DOPA dioxygenase extradiol
MSPRASITLNSATKRLPVVFVGHGSPMNAVEKNIFSNEWARIGNTLSGVQGIICISAHWVTEGTAVTAMKNPRTIHDFYGFPKELYDMRYPAPGSIPLAKGVQKLVKIASVNLDTEWGLDHGTWSVLAHMFPKADIPVVQLSLDYSLSPAQCVMLGQELSSLREQGILIVGSGNIVHNLSRMQMDAKPFAWATAFDKFVRDAIINNDTASLIDFEKNANAHLANPSSEHFLPLLYALGAAKGDRPKVVNEGVLLGSVSMTSVIFGE